MRVALLLVTGCAASVGPDPGLESLALSKVAPSTIIPGTSVLLAGDSFVDEEWGAATLYLVGQAGGGSVNVKWPAKFVDFSTMKVPVDAGMIQAVGGAVDFHGTAIVEVVAVSDGQTYTSKPLTVDLSFRQHLTPTPTGLDDGGVHFVNDLIEVDGDGFLLGGDEGTTVARLTGCFTLDSGGGCTDITQLDIPMQPMDPLARTKASFPFSPKVAGIQPGTFTGHVAVVNLQTGQAEIAADPLAVNYSMVSAQIFSVDPGTASLGQYVFIHGGGFVGGDAGALTQLDLAGTFTKTGGSPVQVQMTLIPEFVEGRLVRYVLNTDDALGHALDLYHDTGSFSGTATPVISFGTDTVRGVSTPAAFGVARVKQIVYLHYQTSYVEGLRDFGMRAVDAKIRVKILEVVREAYKGVNMDFRSDPPTDFALFENVELVGIDPNDMGLFGYDNSPGKDNGNVRLYDQLGGVNAQTQQDGFPGYGGVFLRSLMGF